MTGTPEIERALQAIESEMGARGGQQAGPPRLRELRTAIEREVRRLRKRADAITQTADQMRSQTCASHDLAVIPYADAQWLVCVRDTAIAERDRLRAQLDKIEAHLMRCTEPDGSFVAVMPKKHADIYERGYRRGLSVAWEAVRNIRDAAVLAQEEQR